VPLVASLSRGLYPLATGSAAAALSCQRDQTALIGEMTNTDLDSVFSASSGRQCSKVFPRFLFVRFYFPVQSTPHELPHLERTLQSLLLSSVILPAMHGSAHRSERCVWLRGATRGHGSQSYTSRTFVTIRSAPSHGLNVAMSMCLSPAPALVIIGRPGKRRHALTHIV
jgi:hypothetical protein